MNPLRAVIGRAFAAGLSSIAKDGEAFAKRVETEAETIAKALGKARQAAKEVADEIDRAIEDGRR